MNSYNNQQISNQPMSNQQGFTLIELMISITLGLLVIAIGSQIYLTSYKTNTIQQSASEIQASSIFGIQQMEDHIRLANLGNNTQSIKANTAQGGIVLTEDNIVGTGSTASSDVTTLIDNILTSPKTPTEPARLTIQYQNASDKKMYDCEGDEIANSRDHVIESYYLLDEKIFCNAGRWNRSATGEITMTGMDNRGGIPVIRDVERFELLLGVQNSDLATALIDVDSYRALPNTPKYPQPIITSVKMGFLLKGSKPLATTDEIRTKFTIFDKDITIDSSDGRYIRNVYESTVLLRNARGQSEEIEVSR